MFTDQVNRFIRKTGIDARLVFRKMGLDTYSDILRRSPVDEGRFRGSNRLSINRVDASFEDEDFSSGIAPQAPATSGEIAGALQELSQFQLGDTIHISNNLPYAEPIENGHSEQAPGGVYRLAFEQLVTRFPSIVRSINQ